MSKQKKNASPKTAKVEIIRHGRDEMNLVEYPFASLWKNTGPGTEILHEWQVTHPITGKNVKAFWRVTGDSKLGLPTASDEQLYLVLMELTQESGIQNQIVHFTRYDMLKRLGCPDQPQYYDALRDAFTRLLAVTITSQNAFWDAKARSFRTVGFNLLDNFDILEERKGRKKRGQSELPLSFFKWNDVLFDSFQAGYLKTLDLDFALSLKRSIAMRLYRYLDKKSFDARRTFQIDLAGLCERHLGMRPSPYPSKYKERLKPAHDELIARGFLESVSYEKMKTKKGDKACYVFVPRQESIALRSISDESVAVPTDQIPAAITTPSTLSKETEQSKPQPNQTVPLEVFSDEVFQQMLALKISSDVASELLQSASEEEIKIQLDCLSDRSPNDTAATFVKAVREGWRPPLKYIKRQDAAKGTQSSKTPKASKNHKEAVLKALESHEKENRGINGDEVDVLKQMSEIGIEAEVAEKILTQYALEEIAHQLACLADRKPRDPAALFLYALRRELPAPATYLERITQRQQQEMALATTQEARQDALATAQRIKETREIQRRQMGTTTAFYENLSDRAKAIVRQRVDVELNQFGAQGRLLYPHPDWIQVLGSLLSDEDWAASLGKWEDDWDEDATESAVGQNSLFARLDLYVETLRSLLQSGQVNSQNLEQVREKSFPLLDNDEWEAVKERALNDNAV